MYNRLFINNERRVVWKYGEYIRTNNGVIRKIELIRKDKVDVDEVYRRYGYLTETVWNYNIVKHSKNIIDLIEVGDIVKVYVFADISDDDSEAVETYYRIESEYKITELKESIKINYAKILSILTKEQYEQNSYKL